MTKWWLGVALGAALGCAGQRSATRSQPAASAYPAAPSPTARELSARASAAYNRKAYLECAQLWDEAAPRARHRDPLLSVSAACCWALGGNADRAFASLDRALQQGYHRPEGLEDGDLASLRGDPRWPAVRARVQQNRDEYMRTANAELLRLYDEDQADRQGDAAKIDWKKVTPRDQARQARVRVLVDRGDARVSADFYHAAMIFQHAHEVELIAFAHQLALRSVALDSDNLEARWLAAATEDRRLMRQGKPQRYGTQKVRADGRWTLYSVDPTVTDDERDEWCVPPLAAAQSEVEQLNASAH